MTTTSQLQKLMVFRVGNYYLSLPIATILRVLPAAEHQVLADSGLLQLGGSAIPLIDLHTQLGERSESPCILIVSTPQGERWGLWVDDPPDLLDVATDMCQALNPAQRQRSSFPLAAAVSHLMVTPQGLTIFILDLLSLLKALD